MLSSDWVEKVKTKPKYYTKILVNMKQIIKMELFIKNIKI